MLCLFKLKLICGAYTFPDLDLGPGSHGYEPSTLPSTYLLRYTAFLLSLPFHIRWWIYMHLFQKWQNSVFNFDYRFSSLAPRFNTSPFSAFSIFKLNSIPCPSAKITCRILRRLWTKSEPNFKSIYSQVGVRDLWLWLPQHNILFHQGSVSDLLRNGH